jgi:hypothetical protein
MTKVGTALVMMILASNNMIPHISTGNSEKDLVFAGAIGAIAGVIIVEIIQRLSCNMMRLKKEK